MSTNITYEEGPFDPGAAAATGSEVQSAALRMDERALSVLERYWQALITRRLLIASIILLSMAVGVIAYLMATPQYQATSRIEITRVQTKVTNVQGIDTED